MVIESRGFRKIGHAKVDTAAGDAFFPCLSVKVRRRMQKEFLMLGEVPMEDDVAGYATPTIVEKTPAPFLPQGKKHD